MKTYKPQNVVCIKKPPTFVEIDIKIGSTYSAFVKSYSISNKLDSNAWFVKCGLGNTVPCDFLDKKKYFISLDQWRINRLNLLDV